MIIYALNIMYRHKAKVNKIEMTSTTWAVKAKLRIVTVWMALAFYYN